MKKFDDTMTWTEMGRKKISDRVWVAPVYERDMTPANWGFEDAQPIGWVVIEEPGINDIRHGVYDDFEDARAAAIKLDDELDAEMRGAMKLQWEAIEDNGGGLHLAVIEDNYCIYFASGYEHTDGNLSRDIAGLRAGDHPVRDGWDVVSDGNPDDMYSVLISHEYGWQVVADQDGVYPDRMGAAARREFKVEPE